MVHAVLDVVATRPDRVTKYCDITIRAPIAIRYSGAAEIDGKAIQQAEQEKRTAYPDKAGMSCTRLVWETWGRCSTTVHAFLDEIAADTAQRQRDRGQRSQELLSGFLQEASCLLARAIACRLLRAQEPHSVQ